MIDPAVQGTVISKRPRLRERPSGRPRRRTMALHRMSRSALLLATALATTALAAGACHDHDGLPFEPSRGDLGFAVFRWDCTLGEIEPFDGSPTCDDIEFPRTIAVGASFTAGFELSGNVPDEVDARGLESASPRFMSGSGGQFTALRSGRVALLALGRDSVIDYITLRLYPVDRVVVAAAEQQPQCIDAGCRDVVFDGGAFVLVPGQEVRVVARPFADSTRLFGELQWSWTSESPELLGVTTEASGAALLEPRAPGTATLVVSGNGITQTVTLSILDAPPPPPTPTDDSGTDTGASGDSGDSGTESATMGDDTGSTSEPGDTGASATGGATSTGTGGAT